MDVWLNNPLPSYEASGTSGMKAGINGVPHLSVLDGWWIEGYREKNGWAFDGSLNHSSDAEDSKELYTFLENEIAPLYYDRDESGIPQGWVRVMKESIKSISPNFSSRRMVKEYALNFCQDALKYSNGLKFYSGPG